MAEYWRSNKSSSLPPSYYQYNRSAGRYHNGAYYKRPEDKPPTVVRHKVLWQSVAAVGAFALVLGICTSERADLAGTQEILRECFVADTDVAPVISWFDNMGLTSEVFSANDSEVVRANAVARIDEEMAVPAAGKVIGTFGWQSSASSGFSPGITIETVANESVKAAYAGTVLVVQEGTEGYTVMLAHNNGLVTTYGHLSQVYVKADQIVEKGQVIATAGEVMKEKGEVYFETKHLGEPIDPLTLLRGKEI